MTPRDVGNQCSGEIVGRTVARSVVVLTCVVAGLCVALMPGLAGAASASHTPVAPEPGKWVFYNSSSGFGPELIGSMVVSSGHKYVKHFSGTLGSGADSACGTGKLRVVGKLKIIDAKGENELGNHYNEWAVGRNTPSKDPAISPEKVTLVHAGKRIKGHIYLVFEGRKGVTKKYDSGGEVTYAGGNCDLSFEVKKR